LCQLFVIRYSLFVLLFVILHLFCSLFDYLLFSSHWFFACFIVVRKSNSDPEPCSGISIPLTVTFSSTRYLLYKKYLFSTSSSQVNKHHTADSTDFVLVLEAKEPITIIEKRDRRNQYSPYINLAEGETVGMKFKWHYLIMLYSSRICNVFGIKSEYLFLGNVNTRLIQIRSKHRILCTHKVGIRIL
jgi:hypothetical protein